MIKSHIRTIGVFAAISGLWASPVHAGGRADKGLGSICGDCTVEKFATCGGFLEGPIEDAHGSVWLVDVIGGRIFEIDTNGKCQERLKTGTHPNGAQFREDGRMLIADSSGLLLYDPASNKTESIPVAYEGRALTGLNDLAIAPDGGIYFTVPGRSSLAVPDGQVFYRSSEGEVRRLGEHFAYSNGVELSPNGEMILVANFAAKEVISLPAITAKSPFATTYLYARTQGGVGPDGIRADKSGNLFVANLGAGEVLVFNPNAQQMGSIRLPASAGLLTSNVALGKSYLYITEAGKGEVWRVKLRK